LYPRNLSKFVLTLALLFSVVVLMSTASKPAEKVLKGRIVAQAENNAEDFGSGSFLGSSQHYVFEIEHPNARRELVKVFYVFKNTSDRLPTSYLDYSIVRSFTVTRDTLCDDSLEHMAYTQAVDASGHVHEHQFTLKMAKNAPKLEISGNRLTCYMLRPDGLKASAH
jgi:hypothetical protein